MGLIKQIGLMEIEKIKIFLFEKMLLNVITNIQQLKNKKEQSIMPIPLNISFLTFIFLGIKYISTTSHYLSHYLTVPDIDS